MGFSVGLVGLPNAGKSTVFNALTAAGAEVGAYPFTTVGRNLGARVIPDERLDTVARITRPVKVTPTALEIVDIAGLVPGAHRGEGLGNQFLGYIREVDLIGHVVRCFENERVAPVDGQTDPVRDAETVELELALADLDTVERRLERARRRAKGGVGADQAEVETLERLRESLARGIPAHRLALASGATALVRELFLLTSKPHLYIGNVSDRDFEAAAALGANRSEPGGFSPGPTSPGPTSPGLAGWAALAAHAARSGTPAVPVAAAVEAEWAALPIAERALWQEEFGLAISGGVSLVRAAYEHLNVMTFYTVNENEARAYTVTKGTSAVAAAGKVHTDMERGFIRAEVVRFSDLERAGSMAAARQKGTLRAEGRDYVVQDGDILYFRFAPPAN